MSQNKKEIQTTNANVKVTATAFLGPLPAPEILERYAQIDPAIVDKIINAANEERHHRHEMDRKMAEVSAAEVALPNEIHKRDFRDKQLGRIFILSVMTIIMGGTFFVITTTNETAGWIALFAEILVFAGMGLGAQRKKKS